MAEKVHDFVGERFTLEFNHEMDRIVKGNFTIAGEIAYRILTET